MIKVLIADTDELTLKQLDSVNWSAVGAMVVGTADSGEKALNLAKLFKPDIIITDIKKPGMDGFELAQAVTIFLPDVKIIILSGCADFTCAQKAISVGVFEYILKPFLTDSLLDSVKRAIPQIKALRTKNTEYESMLKQIELNKPFLKSYFLDNIADFHKDASFNAIFGAFPDLGKYMTVVVSMDSLAEPTSYEKSYRLFCEATKIVIGIDVRVIPFFEVNQFTYIFIFNGEDTTGEVVSRCLSIAEMFKEYMHLSSDTSFTIGVGNCVAYPEKIKNSYTSALDAVKYSFYMGADSVIYISDLEAGLHAYDYGAIYENTLFDAVRVGALDLAIASLDKLFDTFIENKEDISYVQRICHNIIAKLSICFIQCNQSPDILYNKSDIWSIIREHKDINQLRRFMCDIISVSILQIGTVRENQNDVLINEIKQYMDEKLSASLVEIAEHFHMSPNYISKIFSHNAGITIKNYMINRRMEHAKDMLKNTNKTISEIATAIGYDVKYMGKLFKKVVGVTPIVYRENNNPINQ